MPDSKDALAVRLGLKPYSAFEELILPLFKRVPAEERDQILRKIYSLAGKKLVMEFEEKEISLQRLSLEEKQKSLQATRRHLETAAKELLAAEESFHKDLPRWINVQPTIGEVKEMNRILLENEGMIGRTVATLKDQEGKIVTTQLEGTVISTTVTLTSPAVTTPLDLTSPERYQFPFPERRGTAIDYWFILAVNDCLPKAQPGKRSRFGRDEIIGKVFEFLGQHFTRERITKARARESRQKN
jgi:hypothetical protein